MFSGIIADVGHIAESSDRDGGLCLVIATSALDLGDVQLGDSIAVNGVCLTVVAHSGNSPDPEGGAHQAQEGQSSDCSRNRLALPVTCRSRTFTVDVSRETLNCTEGLDAIGAPVNLEKALRLADRLGGHLVSGHVDGVGEVVEFTDLGESWKLVVRAPQALARYIAVKGSITINGVSLTVNQVAGNKVNASEFSVNLIPHTLLMTNLKNLRAGSRINLEVDMIARYVERMMQEAK
jgi:riboflavin synthase